MIGALLRGSPDPLAFLDDIRSDLRSGKLQGVSHSVKGYPLPDLSLVFDRCVRDLDGETWQSAIDLAIFPEGNRFPLKTLYRMWGPDEDAKVRRVVSV